MSSRKVSSIDSGAIISANDLRSGRTVYLAANGDWSLDLKQAVVIKEDVEAESRLQSALLHADVVGADVIKTTEQGEPLHIRELIRALGPSIAKDNAASALLAGGSNVPLR